MTQDGNTLKVRVVLNNTAPQSEKVSYQGYRWDRILIAIALVISLGVIITWFLGGVTDEVAPIAEQPEMTQTTPPASNKVVAADEDFDDGATKDQSIEITERLGEAESTASQNTEQLISATNHSSGLEKAHSSDKESSTKSSLDRSKSTSTALKPNNQQAKPSLIPGETKILSVKVARFVLSKAMQSREPLGTIADIRIGGDDDPAVAVYAFSDIKDLAGSPVYYRWLRNEKQIAKIRVDIGSDSWRSSSSKLLNRKMSGRWRVELRSAQNELLAYTEFYY